MYSITRQLVLVPGYPCPLAHLLCCSRGTLATSPAPCTQPAYDSRCQGGRKAHPHGEKHGLVDRVCQHEHGVQSVMAAAARRCALHLVPAWLGRLAVHDAICELSHVCGRLRDLLGAEELDPDKGDGEVERGEGEVHAERIPAVGLYEVLEALGDGGGRGGGGRGGGEAGWGCAEGAGGEEDASGGGGEEGRAGADEDTGKEEPFEHGCGLSRGREMPDYLYRWGCTNF